MMNEVIVGAAVAEVYEEKVGEEMRAGDFV